MRVRAMVALAAMAAAFVATGCQSARIREVVKHREIRASRSVVVHPFDTSSAEWSGDHGEHTLAEVHDHFLAHLRSLLVARGFQVAEGGDAVTVGGRVVLVHAGSGAARMWVGMGAGQSKFVVNVEVGDGTGGGPAWTFRVQGGTGGSGGWQKAGYPTLADARDAAEQIVDFLAENVR